MATNQELLKEREQRLATTIALGTPDRVPIAPKMNHFYGDMYGVNCYTAASDPKTLVPAVKEYIREYQPDGVWQIAQHSNHVVDLLGTKFVRCPGGSRLGINDHFQILDDEFMYEDEYLEFAKDPTTFIINKWLPRRHSELAGLAKVNFQDWIEYGIYGAVATFGDPEVKKAFEALQAAAYHSKVWLEGGAAFANACIEEGVPVLARFGHTCPFDVLSDNFRGMMNMNMDILMQPEGLEEALEAATDIVLKYMLNPIKAFNDKYLFIPLHGGVDEFMSKENYAKYYWPGLKKMTEKAVAEGITPYVFCEGNYDTRLEQLMDVPKGKVVYMFEKVDMKRAKETVGQVACIGGNLPTATLMYGTKEQVIDQTKELLDTCAPGGGFIMDCSIVMDNCPKENLHAMFETALTYGKY